MCIRDSVIAAVLPREHAELADCLLGSSALAGDRTQVHEAGKKAQNLVQFLGAQARGVVSNDQRQEHR
eukprot:3670306-Prorocentrum_lima.AAC.1